MNRQQRRAATFKRAQRHDRNARVEVDYLKATGQDVSNFIDGIKAPDAPPAISQTPTGTLHRLSDGRLVHRLGGDDEETTAA